MRNPTLLTAALVIAVSLSGACGLLDTEQPNIIDPGTLDSPAGATALRDGALADFGFAKDGDGSQVDDGLILVTGLLTDEFMHSTTPPSQQEIDQRTPSVDNPSVSDPYRNLHKARVGAENAAQALQEFSLAPNDTTEVILFDSRPARKPQAEPVLESAAGEKGLRAKSAVPEKRFGPDAASADPSANSGKAGQTSLDYRARLRGTQARTGLGGTAASR